MVCFKLYYLPKLLLHGVRPALNISYRTFCLHVTSTVPTQALPRYVRLVEGDIHDSFTLHQRGEDGRYSRRITNAKHSIRDVFVPPHLYGQLVQHDKGFQLLLKEGKLENIFQ
ncbi:unnamed protein product, partial [Timema podura]|nr:unnamed protein product [Timema podura]